MLGLENIPSRVASRRAILVGIAGIAVAVIFVDRIAVAATESVSAQARLRQHGESRESGSGRSVDVGPGGLHAGARVRLSLPAYFPLE